MKQNKNMQKPLTHADVNAYLPALIEEIGLPDPQKAVTQLKELCDKGYIEAPDYVFEARLGANNTMLWHSKCYVPGWGYTRGSFFTKKRGTKKSAALEMLCRILQY